MLPTDEISTGEISRNLDALRIAFDRIENKLDNRPAWQDINRLEQARDKADGVRDEAIKALEDAQTWLMRSTVGAIITALVGVVLAVVAK